ncbi:MAG: hypothetical protein IPH45_21375 [Bacteroidales bacterium]|nr:hypothetical protein [Bacteroidales bacterium]
MAFDMLSYSVEVNNTLTGCSNTGQLTIMFTFGECSYGIPEGNDAASVMVFPNPNHGVFYCGVNVEEKDLEMEILNLQGTIKRDHFEVTPGVTKTLQLILQIRHQEFIF